MHKMLTGALAGFAATAPMTAAMILMHRRLPLHQRYSLPPRRITMNVADVLGMKHEMSQRQRTAATLAAHFGYGSAMGGVYAAAEEHLPAPPMLKGVGWGLTVWAGSYLGLLPALDLHPSATRHPRRRNLLMIAAHVVWGATLGLLVQYSRTIYSLSRREREKGAAATPSLT